LSLPHASGVCLPTAFSVTEALLQAAPALLVLIIVREVPHPASRVP
jgi:hypothetical protein